MNVIHSDKTAVGKKRAAFAKGAALPTLAGAVLLPRQTPDERDVYALVSVDNIDFLLQDPTLAVMGDYEETIEAQIKDRHPCHRGDASYLVRCSGIRHSYRYRFTEKDKKKFKDEYSKRGALANGWEWRSREVKGWIVSDRAYVADPQDADHLKAITIDLGPVIIDEDKFDEIFGSFDDRTGPGVRSANEDGFSVVDRQLFHVKFVQVNYNPNVARHREYRAKRREISHRLATSFPATVTYSAYAILNPNHWPGGHIGAGHLRGKQMYERGGWGSKKLYTYDERECMAVLALGRRMNKNKTWYRSVTEYDIPHNGIEHIVKAAFPMIHSVEKRIRRDKAEFIANLREEYQGRQQRYRRFQDDKADYEALIRLQGEGGVVIEDQLVEKNVHVRYNRDTREHEYEDRMVAKWSWPDYLHDFVQRLEGGDHEEPTAYPGTEDDYVAEFFPARWANQEAAAEAAFCRWLRQEANVEEIPLPKPPVVPKPPKKVKRRKMKRRKRRKRRQPVHDVGADFVRHVTRQAGRAAG